MKKLLNKTFIIINILIIFCVFSSCYASDKNFSFENNNSGNIWLVVQKPEKIELNENSIQLENGKATKLTTTITPENAFNKKVTWETSDSTVATVDSNGNVKAISVGTAIITAKTRNEKIAKCTIIVKNPIIEATELKLNKTEIKLEENKTEKLIATIIPANVTNKTLIWKSSNPKVATVDNTGNIKAVSVGKTTVTVKTSNGKTATANIEVKNINVNVKLNHTSLKVVLEDTKTIQLIANVTPENVADKYKSVIWTSSNNEIATVNSKGLVTLKNKGTVTIQAQTSNKKTAKCKIVVETYKNKTNNASFLKIAKDLHEYLRKNNYYYPTRANVAAGRMVEDYNNTRMGYDFPFRYPKFGEASNTRYVDCSSYVSWVISAYTGTPIKKKSAALRKNPMNFITVTVRGNNKNKSLKAGDVIVKNGHTEIYAGNGMSYSCGSTSQIRAVKSVTMPDWQYAFRIPKSLEFRLKNIQLINAKDKGTTGETIQIKAIFNGKIYSSKTGTSMKASKVPVLKIKFGNGEIRTISNNSKNVEISSNGKEIIYTYKITSKDKGTLQLVSYTGTVYNVSGVGKKISSNILTGKLIIVNQ